MVERGPVYSLDEKDRVADKELPLIHPFGNNLEIRKCTGSTNPTVKSTNVLSNLSIQMPPMLYRFSSATDDLDSRP